MSASFNNRLLRAGTAFVLLTLLAGCGATMHSKPGTTTTVVLTRHADRDPDEDDLNARGRERAQALIAAVSHLKVTAIYSPNVRRNLDTARPLAQHLGLEITLTPVVSFFHSRAIVQEILTRHSGGVVVYVGNASGNLQAVYRQLGGTGTSPAEYGELHILTVPDAGPVTVDRRHYGPAKSAKSE